MAVIMAKGNNTLGTIGTLASIAGMATGTPWLSTLGLGMGAAGNIINGNNTNMEQQGALAEILKNLGGWFNPAKDNPAKVDLTDEELAKKWNPYLDTRGYYGWGA